MNMYASLRKEIVVYVVYSVKKNDLDMVEVFSDYRDAKYFVSEAKKNGRDLSIWERPIK